ncbi:MAG TPA: GNAT family N-acetyltransferase [Firmicutes bacterium]|nr:GNAT family N-acetyltransferase [Bacillota bacterium]
MKIFEAAEREKVLIDQLLKVWESSVKATHLFLSESEIENIKKYVLQALKNIPHLIVAENEIKLPIAFMGIEGQKLEMLFVASEERGKGIGKKLVKYGMKKYLISELTVNEQNPLAKGFYEHMGFKVYKRAENDEQGEPHPILYMKLI